MRKTMIIFILFFLVPGAILAQNWQTITGTNYATNGFFTSGSGWRPGNKQFAVNPYNASIWMAMDNEVTGFDTNGNFFVFDYTNVPVFTSNTNISTFLEFGFTSSYVFAVDRDIGLLRFNGANWTIIETQDFGNAISSDNDSVWVAYEGMNYITCKDGFTSPEPYSGFQRIVSRSGEIWGNDGNNNGFLYSYVGGSASLFNGITEPYLLDNSNYDFKFARNSDTLFTAGDRGFSLAYQGAFFDTLTSYNTSNMPWSVIREFEFDHEDNIWALFGNDATDYVGVAHYNQISKTWNMIYDGSNSPVNWSSRVTIEVDANGNLYVHDRNDIHILKINNWPQWLDVIETELIHFEIYPNPSNGDLKIQIDEGIEVSEIQILDLNGRVLESSPYSETITINKQAGVYLVRLLNSNTVIGTRKIIKL